MRGFFRDVRSRPVRAIACALCCRRVQAAFGVVLLVGVTLWLVHGQRGTSTAAASPSPQATPTTLVVADSGNPNSTSAPGQGASNPDTANQGAASQGPSKQDAEEFSLDDPVTKPTRPFQEEWQTAWEVATGKEWTASPAAMIELSFGTVTVERDPRNGMPLLQLSIKGDDDGHVSGMAFKTLKLDDSRLKRLKGLPYLKSLDFTTTDLDAVTDVGLAALSECARLEIVDLHDHPISDEYLVALGGCPKLRALDVRGTRVTDAGLKRLQNAELQYLNLSGTKVTERGLSELGRFTKLERLWFKDSGVKDWSYLPHLKPLSQLKEYDMVLPVKWLPVASRDSLVRSVEGTWGMFWRSPHYKRPTGPIGTFYTPSEAPPVTGGDILEAIQNMKALEEVDLSFAPCADDDLKLLAKLENVKVLDLSWSKELTAAGLAHLSSLKSLRYLDLSETSLRYEDLRTLKALRTLTDVGVNNVRLTKEEVQRLEEELPKVKFHSWQLRA